MRWARVLLNELPNETTAAFIEYYTGKYIPHEKQPEEEAVEVHESGNAIQNYVSLLSLPYMGSSTPVAQTTEETTKPIETIDPAHPWSAADIGAPKSHCSSPGGPVRPRCTLHVQSPSQRYSKRLGLEGRRVRPQGFVVPRRPDRGRGPAQAHQRAAEGISPE